MKILKSRFYPVDYTNLIIYDDPKTRAKDAEWVEPYRSLNVIAIKGARLITHESRHAAFTIRPALVKGSPTSDPVVANALALLDAISEPLDIPPKPTEGEITWTLTGKNAQESDTPADLFLLQLAADGKAPANESERRAYYTGYRQSLDAENDLELMLQQGAKPDEDESGPRQDMIRALYAAADAEDTGPDYTAVYESYEADQRAELVDYIQEASDAYTRDMEIGVDPAAPGRDTTVYTGQDMTLTKDEQAILVYLWRKAIHGDIFDWRHVMTLIAWIDRLNTALAK